MTIAANRCCSLGKSCASRVKRYKKGTEKESDVAKTIAKAFGYDKSRVKETHRLGSETARAEANTWRTFSTAYTRADGSGYVQVMRDREVIHYFEYGPECGVTPVTT